MTYNELNSNISDIIRIDILNNDETGKIMNLSQICYSFLEEELNPALGCTEPAAIAYACALASSLLSDEIQMIRLHLSNNLIKNATGASIPNSDSYGIAMAAALGAVIADGKKKLLIFEDVTAGIVASAKGLIDHGRCEVQSFTSGNRIQILADCQSAHQRAVCFICGGHTNVVFNQLINNNVPLPLPKDCSDLEPEQHFLTAKITLADLCDFCDTADPSRMIKVKQSLNMALALAAEGLRAPYGLSCGRTLRKAEITNAQASLSLHAKVLTAAAADARMGGCQLPAMSLCGSGNQCLAATLPIVAVAQRLRASETDTLCALALSYLVTVFIKQHTGKLSALCGCAIAAAAGSSAGICKISGGTRLCVINAIQNVVGDLTGMICDGAKPGCALKLASSADASVQSALLALNGSAATARDGIVAAHAEESIRNLGLLDRDGMQSAEQEISKILLCKCSNAD